MKQRALLTFIVLLAWLMRVGRLEQLPPGIDRDTAINGVYTLYILHEGWRSLFYRVGAIEPFIVYLQALSVAAFGVNVFALRFVTAVSGTLSVVVLYTFVRALKFERSVALLSAFGMAICVEHLHLSRLGLRAIFIPLFGVLWLWWWWRGWCAGRWRDFLLAGVFLGASIYTYISALFFPLVLFALIAHQGVFASARVRSRAQALGLMAGTAFVVASPMLLLMLQYPSAAFFRASQVTLFAHPDYERLGLVGVVTAKLIAQAKMFGIEWQGQYNPLSQPLLDPLWFVLFVSGLGLCVRHARRIEYAWAPLMLVVMLLPDLLGGNEPFPHELRVIGVIPPAFFIAGLGGMAWFRMNQRWSPRWSRVMATVVLMWSALQSFDAYFHRWGSWTSHNDHPDFNRAEVTEGRWIAQQREAVLVPLNEYARQPVRYLSATRAPKLRAAGDLHAFPVEQMWLLLPLDPTRARFEGRAYSDDPFAFVLVHDDAAWLLPPLTNEALTNLNERVRSLPVESVKDEIGNEVARAFRIESHDLQLAVPLSSTPTWRFEPELYLLSAEIGATRVLPGESLPLTLWWQPTQRLDEEWIFFVHLLGPEDELAAGIDVVPALGAYPTFVWKPNELIPTHHLVRIPTRVSPGQYRIEIGWYNVLNGERLKVFDTQSHTMDERVIVGNLKVTPRVLPTFTPTHLQRANFDGQIALLGYDIRQEAARQFQVTLYFHGLTTLTRDYTLFVHLLDARGEIVAQFDHQPQQRRYPTSIWEFGEQVRDEFVVTLPPDAPAGKYQLVIGWYDWQTGARLPLRDGFPTWSEDALVLAVLEVK